MKEEEEEEISGGATRTRGIRNSDLGHLFASEMQRRYPIPYCSGSESDPEEWRLTDLKFWEWLATIGDSVGSP